MARYGGLVPFSEDPLWVASPLIDKDLFNVLARPQEWIQNPANVSGNPTVKYPVTISFEPIVTPEQSDPRKFWLQGISGTNVLTIRIPSAGAEAYVYDWLDTYDGRAERAIKAAQGDVAPTMVEWLTQVVQAALGDAPPDLRTVISNLYYNRPILTTVVNQDRAYSHFQITVPKTLDRVPPPPPDLKGASLVGLFHLFAAAYPTVVDDVLNNGAPTAAFVKVVNGEIQPDPSAKIDLPGSGKFKQKHPTETLPMTMIVNDPALPHPLDADEEICEMLVAEYEAGDGWVTYSEAFSKPYSG
jgi:hypothetical protein